ncbi:unnamed protein product [Rotaria socialis]|uniref:Uncharacterized protein n=1 Tax=Rotaria socialis TaxID=392032 RepID=A0A820IVC8_9BILA|nr:unnamed protein product [Rotaria socialis]
MLHILDAAISISGSIRTTTSIDATPNTTNLIDSTFIHSNTTATTTTTTLLYNSNSAVFSSSTKTTTTSSQSNSSIATNICHNLTFNLSFKYEYSGFAIFLSVGEFNGDNYTDLVVSNTEDSSLNVVLSYGNGRFESQITTELETAMSGAAVVDFNGDSHTDLAISFSAIADANLVNVFLGYGNETFVQMNSFVAGILSFAIVSVDFNHDNHSDVAVANYAGQAVTVHMGIGNGTFLNRRTYISSSSPAALATDDFNHDQHIDWIATYCENNSISVLLFAVGDFNRDNHLDIIFSLFELDCFNIMFGDGSDAMLESRLFDINQQPCGIALYDFNDDNRLDFVRAHNFMDASVHLNTCL